MTTYKIYGEMFISASLNSCAKELNEEIEKLIGEDLSKLTPLERRAKATNFKNTTSEIMEKYENIVQTVSESYQGSDKPKVIAHLNNVIKDATTSIEYASSYAINYKSNSTPTKKGKKKND